MLACKFFFSLPSSYFHYLTIKSIHKRKSCGHVEQEYNVKNMFVEISDIPIYHSDQLVRQYLYILTDFF